MMILLSKPGIGGLFDHIIGSKDLQSRIDNQQGITVKSVSRKESTYAFPASTGRACAAASVCAGH